MGTHAVIIHGSALPADELAAIEADLAAHREQPPARWLPVVPPAGWAGLIAGHEVLPHVQRFADAVMIATGVRSIGTYPGHSPSIDRALDLFHAISDTALADAISDFGIRHQAKYGVRYIIDRQEIWHRLDPVWRHMEDRGDNTQNHRDHNHISFELVAAEPDPEPTPEPEPEPIPEPEEPDVAKSAYPLEVRSGQTRKLPVLAIGGGFGWTKTSVTFASAGVAVQRAIVGPNERPIAGLAPEGPASSRRFDGRGYVDLTAGDEWILIELAKSPAGTLDLYVEASDA